MLQPNIKSYHLKILKGRYAHCNVCSIFIHVHCTSTFFNGPLVQNTRITALNYCKSDKQTCTFQTCLSVRLSAVLSNTVFPVFVCYATGGCVGGGMYVFFPENKSSLNMLIKLMNYFMY